MAGLWLAAALMPALARVWQDPAAAALEIVCTTAPLDTAALSTDASSKGTPLPAHSAGHCPLCSLHGALPLLPAPAAFDFAPALRFEAPALAAPAPASRLAWTRPLSRAPPLQS